MSSSDSPAPSSSSAQSASPAAKPPPGWVIGPDGKPCKICTSFRNWKSRPAASAASSSSRTSAAATAVATGGATAALAGQTTSASDDPVRPEHCPPDVEALGRATWTFLHTTAAYYPERPSAAHRANMLLLLRALPTLYPCTHCAADLGERVAAHPPDVSGRLGLSRWLCERHNEVNVKLGKEKFSCAIERLDERWKDGPSDGSCG